MINFQSFWLDRKMSATWGVGPATGALVLQRCRNRLRGPRKIFERKILDGRRESKRNDPNVQVLSNDANYRLWAVGPGRDGCSRRCGGVFDEYL